MNGEKPSQDSSSISLKMGFNEESNKCVFETEFFRLSNFTYFVPSRTLSLILFNAN